MKFEFGAISHLRLKSNKLPSYYSIFQVHFNIRRLFIEIQLWGDTLKSGKNNQNLDLV